MKKKIIVRVISSILILSAIVLNVNILAENPNNDFTLSKIVSNAHADGESGGQMYEDIFYPVTGGWTICCEEDVTDGCWRWAWPICP